jgi:uncharacterized protein
VFAKEHAGTPLCPAQPQLPPHRAGEHLDGVVGDLGEHTVEGIRGVADPGPPRDSGGPLDLRRVVFGISGPIGTAIAAELIRRGHAVTGVTRSGNGTVPGVVTTAGDATDADEVANLVREADAVISAVGPRKDGSDGLDSLVPVTNGLVDGLRKGGVARLLVIGGAGSLREGDTRHLDSDSFPAQYRPLALAHATARDIYFTVTDLDWTYVSPPAVIGPGERTGEFRRGGDELIVDANGKSFISAPDFAVGVADELEKPAAARRQITFAY